MLSCVLPPRLTTAGGEVPFEHIPVVGRALRLQAEALVDERHVRAPRRRPSADFYAGRLADFFAGPAGFSPRIFFASRRPLNTRLEQMVEVNRFLGPEERKTAEQLADLVRQKDTLDFHRATQLVLKGWLFVHIPLTYGLLVFSFVHVVLVYAYSGGAR